MRTLWKYHVLDGVFEYQGGSMPQSYSSCLVPDENAIMKTWDWDNIVWKRARQIVFNLQKRIYKAAKSGKVGKAKHLARLLQNSTSNALLAVRRVTTDNTGKRTGGADKKKCVTPKQKMALVEDVMKTVKSYTRGFPSGHIADTQTRAKSG